MATSASARYGEDLTDRDRIHRMPLESNGKGSYRQFDCGNGAREQGAGLAVDCGDYVD
jgi:hypothetical protein